MDSLLRKIEKMKIDWNGFLEELKNADKNPRDFKEYLERKYKKEAESLKDPLWGYELKLYSAMYFNVDKEQELKYAKLIEDFKLNQQKETQIETLVKSINEEARKEVQAKKKSTAPKDPLVKRPRGRPRKETIVSPVKLPSLSSLVESL